MSDPKSRSVDKDSAAGGWDRARLVERQPPSPEGEEGECSEQDEGECFSLISSSEDECLASPPPKKRAKNRSKPKRHSRYSESPPPNNRKKHRAKSSDPRLESLEKHVSLISGYIAHLPQYLTQITQLKTPEVKAEPSAKSSESEPTYGSQSYLTKPGSGSHCYVTVPGTSSSGSNSFLVNPVKTTDNLQLGGFNVNGDQSVIPKADNERLEQLKDLQKFDSPKWNTVRYKPTLKSCSATPGFVKLKVNEELSHLSNAKDYLASAEEVLAGLSNVVLEQKQLLKHSLQSLVNWAAANPQELNPSTLFDKVSALFDPNTDVQKCFDKSMQIICGKRSECIEVRRCRILKEISDQNLKTALMNVPPSSEYLFSQEALQPVINSFGGTETWISAPDDVNDQNNLYDHDQAQSYQKMPTFPSKFKPAKKFKPGLKKNKPFHHKYNRNQYGRPGGDWRPG